MATIQTTAEDITLGDRLSIAGAPFVVTGRIHGAWYLDCPNARFIEFELVEDTTPLIGTNGRSVVRILKNVPVVVERAVGPDSPEEIASLLPLGWARDQDGQQRQENRR